MDDRDAAALRNWKYVEDQLINDHEVVLDYETNGLEKYRQDFVIGGMALRGLRSKRTFYVYFYDFWRSPGEWKFPEELRDRIGRWLLSKILIVFNLQFEAGVSLTYFGVYLRNITDVLIYNRMLGNSGGLKEIAQRRLGAREWVSELDNFNEILGVFLKHCRPTHKGTVRSEMIFLHEGGELQEKIPELDPEDEPIIVPKRWVTAKKRSIRKWNTIKQAPPPTTLEEWSEYFLVTSKMDSEEIIESIGERQYHIYSALKKLIPLAHKHYLGDKYLLFCKRFFEFLWEHTQAGDQEVRYTDVPIEIIAPYAVQDASYTAELYLDMKREISEKGLVRTAEIYNSHAKLGFEMESAGIAWDNDKAGELSKEYYTVAVDRLRSLLTSKKFSSILNLSTQDILKIQTTTNLDELTAFFNPRSTHKSTRDNFSKLLVTGRVRFQMMLYDIYKEWIHRSVDECQIQWPVLWPIIEHLTSISSPTGEKTPDGKDLSKPTRNDVASRYEFIDGLVANSEKVGTKIQGHPGNDPNKWRDNKGNKYTPPELEVFLKFAHWDIPSMDSKVFETLYESFEFIGGIDIDNEETWIIPEFKYLLDFRIYKKVIKSYSTYIWGSLGREAIALIDANSLDRLSQPRIPGHKDERPNDKIWILETSFGVCTAATRRWQAGSHTVTAGSELLDLRVSRFPDGIRVHWDYSQNELVGLARVSQDANLLKAFSEGQDIHRFVASQVYRKPPSEITSTERRFAKSSTFALVYGDSPEGFSVKFMHGDRKGARELFSRIFSAFPTIKDWIAEQHKTALDRGIVFSLLGNPMDVSMPREVLTLSDDEKELLLNNVYTREIKFSNDRELDNLIRKKTSAALRKAQNFPIQSLSSMLAGLGIYYMTEYCRDNNLSTRIDCFTHDSGDIDTQVCDLPRLFTVLPMNAVDRIRDEFDIPVKTDFEIGLSGNSMIGLKEVKVEDTFMTSKFEGHQENLNNLLSRLNLYGVKTSLKIDKDKTEHKSMKDLFLPKKGYSMDAGTSYKVIEGSMELDFSNAIRS
jgi:DNA polymerase family A